jgi:NADH-quinone oxidoreductase subunit G
MVVNTATDRVKFAQRGQLEFLLTSHPLDCPVCDKGGECPLQNLTMEWGPGNTRNDNSDKDHFHKPIPH